jgi:NADH-quinone oxidoreductase subunit J
VNTFITIVFLLISVVILGAALMTVTARNLVHAALWLVAGFFSIGALYLLMQAEFVAVAQVLVYVGAIAVLILFAIMLTPNVTGESDEPIFRRRSAGLLVAAALFGLLLAPALYLQFGAAGAGAPASATQSIAGPVEIGTSFVREYVLPFELASVLLLAALIGAIVIGIDRPLRQRVLTLAEELRMRQVAQAAGEAEAELSGAAGEHDVAVHTAERAE